MKFCGFTLLVSLFPLSRCSMYGFHFNKLSQFLKITLSSPKLVAPCRRVISSTTLPPLNTVSYVSFESNIEYEIRYMVDSGVVGCNWIDCLPGECWVVCPCL